MPYTINGIGNAYYGKQRVHSVHGNCEFCGHFGVLQSYDTTNYIVVLFIPIIPLGNLRVLSACPACNQFRCLPMKTWEASKKKAIDEMKALLESDDDSSEPVKQAIAVAIGYQDAPLLDEVGQHLAKGLTDDFEVQSLLGDAYAYFGRHQEAAVALQNAINVQPDDAVSNRLALAHLRSNNPNAAAPIAEQALASGDPDRRWVIELLINGYQALNDHEQAMKWLTKLEEAVPEFASSKTGIALRRSVEKGAKKAKPVKNEFLQSKGIEVSNTNKRSFSLYYIVGPAIAVVLFAIYIAVAIQRGANERVIVINALNKPYDVTINGKSLHLLPSIRAEMTLGQGTWDIAPSPNNTVAIDASQFNINTSFLARPFVKTVHVINPDRMGVFAREKVYYAVNPQDAPEGDYKLLIGKNHYQVDSVDYVFEPFPQQIKVEGRSTSRTRVFQETIADNDIGALLAITTESNIDPFEYLTNRANYFGDNEILLRLLTKMSTTERFVEYAAKHLDETPLRIGLHRAYQNVMLNAGKQDQVYNEYKKRFDADPKSDEWLYLLARVTEDRELEQSLWDRIAKTEPMLDYAQIECAARFCSRGEYDKAYDVLTTRTTSTTDDPMTQMQRIQILEAAGKYDEVISRSKKIREPFIEYAIPYESRAVVSRDGKDKALGYIEQLLQSGELNQRRTKPVFGPQDATLTNMKMHVAYAAQDFKLYESLIKSKNSAVMSLLNSDAGNSMQDDSDKFDLDVLKGNLDPYLNDGDQTSSPLLTGWEKLATLALLAHDKGNQTAFDAFAKMCIEALQDEDYAEKKLAALLSENGAIDVEELKEISTNPSRKRLITTLLAIQHADQSKELFELTRLYNYEKSSPYWLIDSILEKEASK